MRLPIDTSRLKFLVVAPAEPLRQYEEGKPRESWAPRTDVNGEVLWRVQLVALGDGEAEIIRVVGPGRSERRPGRDGRARWADGAGVGDGRPVGYGLPRPIHQVGHLAGEQRREGSGVASAGSRPEGTQAMTRHSGTVARRRARADWDELVLGGAGFGVAVPARAVAADRRGGRAARWPRARSAGGAATVLVVLLAAVVGATRSVPPAVLPVAAASLGATGVGARGDGRRTIGGPVPRASGARRAPDPGGRRSARARAARSVRRRARSSGRRARGVPARARGPR